MDSNTVSWELTPVLHDAYMQDVMTMDAYVATINNTKYTGKLISTLNSHFPNQNIIHLKRVNSIKKDGENELQVILTLVSEKLIHKIMEHLKQEELSVFISEPYVTQVPSNCVKTRKQFEDAMKLWPLTNFCADKYIESILSHTLFSNLEKIKLENMMKIAIKAALKSKEIGGKGIGAVISYEGEILGIGSDARNLHPLKHATMAAIDMIAWLRQQKSYAPPAWIGDQISDYNISVVNGPNAYLCTDYEVFITREPCTMCAMALLHNRVKRIFYGCKYENGAVGSLFKLHTLPDINHRYEVFAGVLSEECRNIVCGDKIMTGFQHECFT